MKTKALTLLLITILFVSCNNSKTNTTTKISTEKIGENDKEQIEKLIKNVNAWGDSKNGFSGITYYTIDDKTGICTGVDIKKHQLELNKLKKCGYFSEAFIENFNQIGLKLDQMIKTKEILNWKPNEEIGPFGNSSPWCDCQEGGDMKKIIINIITLNDQIGSLSWTWSEPEYSKGFEYQFKVLKENGKWKIAYLEGFDFERNTKLK
jgi:hypothetical protein